MVLTVSNSTEGIMELGMFYKVIFQDLTPNIYIKEISVLS